MFLVVLGISPQGFQGDLHGYILYSCVCLCNCLYVVTERKFNSRVFYGITECNNGRLYVAKVILYSSMCICRL